MPIAETFMLHRHWQGARARAARDRVSHRGRVRRAIAAHRHPAVSTLMRVTRALGQRLRIPM